MRSLKKKPEETPKNRNVFDYSSTNDYAETRGYIRLDKRGRDKLRDILSEEPSINQKLQIAFARTGGSKL